MRRVRKNEGGYVLIMALILMVVVAGYSITLHAVATAGIRSSEFNARKVVANYLAEGGVEAAQKEMQRALADYECVPQECSFDIDGRIIYVTIEQVGTPRTEEDAQGVRTVIQPYLIISTVTYEGTVSSVERVVDAGLTPVFQFAVFYNSDLEILPGPDFTLTGRVHTNGDLYLGSHSTLTIDSDYLRAVGSLYLRRKNDGSLMGGDVNVRVKGDDDFCELEQQDDLLDYGVPSISGFDSDFCGHDVNGDGDTNDPGELAAWVMRSQDLWNGTIKTGEHGLKEVVTPSIQTIKPWVEDDQGNEVKGFYHANAGLIIRGEMVYVGDNNVTGHLPSGTISQKLMYDAREGKDVHVTEIDIVKLNQSGYFPANGLIYAYRLSDTSSEHPNGIRLTNGSELLGPLTVVSPHPVYVWGDYNNTNKKSAAVITDALNILSNAWDDSKGPGNLPSASETTINAAFLTGNQETQPGSYNGGLENLPRFHENWSGVSCNIRGSFVNTFLSEIGQGSWGCGNDVYSPPIRNWDYDLDFNDFNNLPPFTPYVVTITRVVQTNN